MKVSVENFIERSNIIHNNRYEYTKSIYVNNKTNVKIICKEHGEFNQLPINHYSGSGCPHCYLVSMSGNNKKFIENSTKIHKNRYCYDKVIYTKNTNNVIIICKKHGEFKQLPKIHINGKGCPKCGGCVKLTNNIFVERSIEMHKNLYDYSLVNYTNLKTKVIIICKKHGEFKQFAWDHIKGSGCPKCSNKYGILENKWLDIYNINDKYRQYKIDKYIVDGYSPDTNTIYEFNGDYWHGNPKKYNNNDLNINIGKTFGELYKKTLERENCLKELGYRLVSIWESDFLKNNKEKCH